MTVDPQNRADLIAPIRARVEAATSGPWILDPERGDNPVRVWTDGDVDYFGEANSDYTIAYNIVPEDADFIAHARDDIPWLLERLAQSERELATFKANQPPCDGGCNVNDGPMEECSAHGRPVSYVWEIVNRVGRERDELDLKLSDQAAVIDAVRESIDTYEGADFDMLNGRPEMDASEEKALAIRQIVAILSRTPTTDTTKNGAPSA